MKKNWISVFIILSNFLLYFQVYAQKLYSFEDQVPLDWNNVSKGSLSISKEHFKDGRNSLKWIWNAGSIITVNNPSLLSENSKNGGSAIWAWVYNETPSTDSLRFNFSNSSGKVLTGFNFRLNFKGWRFMWVCFGRDLGYRYSDGNELSIMTVQSPSKGNGTLFFDMVETIPNNWNNWHRYSDLQYTVKEKNAEERVESYNQKADTKDINLNDTVTLKLIEERLQEWIIGNNKYKGVKNYDIKYSSTINRINQTKNSSLNQNTLLIRQPNNTVIALSKKDSSGIGLFGDVINYNKTKFTDVNRGWLFEMAMDVALNNGSDKQQLQRTIDILDWMYDQGYAEGSGLGFGLEQLSSGGFPLAFFLIRKYLTKEQYDKYLKTVRWIACNNYNTLGASADNIRASSISKLIYALCIKDPVLRIAELSTFKKYMDNAVAIAPGYFGLIKPDYSIYHHQMPYYSEYGDDAINQAAIILYLMRETKYSLSETSFKNIRNAVLNIIDISENYEVPASVSGRFPSGGKGVADVVPALAYIGLSSPNRDPELEKAFNSLYQTEDSNIIKFIQSAGITIQFIHGLGTTVALNNYEEKVKANPQPYTFCKYLPFSGLFVAKQNDWAFTMKGFGKYLIDFECISNFGRYSRYSSYGHLQIISKTRSLNSYSQDKSFDWVHYPATTALNLPLDKIDVKKPGNNSKERNFGDQTFVGGVSLGEKKGMFSMLLHDKVFDPSFRAKKSIFYFGNLLYFMGSGINCNDDINTTHTTLFQNLSGKELAVNNQSVNESSPFLEKTSKHQIIKNSWGNTYIVFQGENQLSVQKRTQTTFDYIGASTPATSYEIAWLDHGTRPKDATYNYALLMESDQPALEGLINQQKPLIRILQQDNDAHIIYNEAEKTYGYALFNPALKLKMKESIISGVNKPSIIMLQKQNDGSIDLVISDPDLNRPSASENDLMPGKESELEVILFGNYKTEPLNETNISLTDSKDKTIIKVIMKEGASYKLHLLKK